MVIKIDFEWSILLEESKKVSVNQMKDIFDDNSNDFLDVFYHKFFENEFYFCDKLWMENICLRKNKNHIILNVSY